MSTSIAISAAATANAAAANAAAARALDTACAARISSFDPKVAQVAEIQVYAACVRRLHPTESDIDPIAAKVLIVAALLGACLGAWKGYDEFDGLVGAIFMAIMGAAALPIILFLLGAAAYAVRYLFT